jgi:hypothetical protein
MNAKSGGDLVMLRSATMTSSRHPLMGVLKFQTDSGRVALASTMR